MGSAPASPPISSTLPQTSSDRRSPDFFLDPEQISTYLEAVARDGVADRRLSARSSRSAARPLRLVGRLADNGSVLTRAEDVGDLDRTERELAAARTHLERVLGASPALVHRMSPRPPLRADPTSARMPPRAHRLSRGVPSSGRGSGSTASPPRRPRGGAGRAAPGWRPRRRRSSSCGSCTRTARTVGYARPSGSCATRRDTRKRSRATGST